MISLMVDGVFLEFDEHLDPLEDLVVPHETIRNLRIELLPLPLRDDADRLLMGERLLVGTLARERVIHIGDCHDPGGKGDLIPFLPSG
jgi:hypothetical protein